MARIVFLTLVLYVSGQESENFCDREYAAEDCKVKDINLKSLNTVEDFESCAPSVLHPSARNYYMAGSGREVTLRENQRAFKSIYIIPKILRDVSRSNLLTTVLGKTINFPIGVSPVAAQQLAHLDGEIATARAVASLGSVMILSCASTKLLEEVAAAARSVSRYNSVLWMQTYIFKNRHETIQIVHRAQKAGFSAIVVTVDTQLEAALTCEARTRAQESMNISFPNMLNGTIGKDKYDASVTFKDLAWLSRNTYLPIVAKGVLNGADALKAITAGASAILVSNHGGRQMDGAPATIDALPGVVDALKNNFPYTEVYVDGGVRNGYDVYKAIARGARAVFVGRPVLWGLAIAGEEGVHKVLKTLQKEFNETMLVAGYTHPTYIPRESILPEMPSYSCLSPV